MKALEEQRRANQQHERDGDLRDHQAGAKALPVAAGLRAALAHRRGQVPPRREPGRGAEHDAGHQRDPRREGEHAGIDADLLGPRREPAHEGHQQIERQPGEKQPEQAAGQRDQQALGDELSHQAAASGAKRGAHGQFPPAPHRPRQRQVRDIRARNQQHQHRRAGKRQQHRLGAGDELIAEHRGAGHQTLRPLVVPGVIPAERRGDGGDLGGSLRLGHPWRQPPEDAQPCEGAVAKLRKVLLRPRAERARRRRHVDVVRTRILRK